MTSRNDITGDKLQTKPATQDYRDGWDAIFGKAQELMKKNLFKEESNKDEFCCGKSSASNGLCSPCSGHHTDASLD